MILPAALYPEAQLSLQVKTGAVLSYERLLLGEFINKGKLSTPIYQLLLFVIQEIQIYQKSCIFCKLF